LFGLLQRQRGIIISSLILPISIGILCLTDEPLWWKYLNKIELSLSKVIGIELIFLSLIIFLGLYITRKSSIRSQLVKFKLHTLAHYLRDEQNNILQETDNNEYLATIKNLALAAFVERLCSYTQDFFKEITKNNNVACSIRIAQGTDENNREYNTIARSGLNLGRSSTTKGVSANTGIPMYLIQKRSCHGVLLYNNIEQAIKEGAFEKTPNEDFYPNEIKTMMVAPLNAWDGKKQSMIGILFVTSGEENVFFEKHVDLMRFCADLVAAAISIKVYLYAHAATHCNLTT
jgi:hypothetical protein